MECVWRVYGECMESVWRVDNESVWSVYGECMESVWRVYGELIMRVYGVCMYFKINYLDSLVSQEMFRRGR